MRTLVILTRKLPRALMIAVGTVTGCLMTGLGLAIRLQDSIPAGGLAAWFGTSFFDGIGWTAGRTGWALVLAGTFWVAAMAAWGTRNRWGWWTAAAASTISLIFFPGGTLAGIFVLAMMIPFLLHDRPWREAQRRRAERVAEQVKLNVVEPMPTPKSPAGRAQAQGKMQRQASGRLRRTGRDNPERTYLLVVE